MGGEVKTLGAMAACRRCADPPEPASRLPPVRLSGRRPSRVRAWGTSFRLCSLVAVFVSSPGSVARIEDAVQGELGCFCVGFGPEN